MGLNRIVMRLEPGSDLRIDRLHPGICIGRVQIEEHVRYPREHPARALERHDGVLEVRGSRVPGDLRHFLPLLAHACLEGRQIVFIPHPVERGKLIGQRAGLREWVFRESFGHLGVPSLILYTAPQAHQDTYLEHQERLGRHVQLHPQG